MVLLKMASTSVCSLCVETIDFDLNFHIYSVFANSYPMQTDTFLFQLLIANIFNSHQTSFNSFLIDTTYEVLRRVIFKVNSRLLNNNNV